MYAAYVERGGGKRVGGLYQKSMGLEATSFKSAGFFGSKVGKGEGLIQRRRKKVETHNCKIRQKGVKYFG